jgi:predicted enzyme related to lactoylglutathione lyase
VSCPEGHSNDPTRADCRRIRAASATSPSRVVHLELHTNDLKAASAFYSQLLGWRTERIDSRWGGYHTLLLGNGLDGGIVECGTAGAGWLPYVEVVRIDAATDQARRLGASVLLGPREGPAGWRSIVSTPACGEIALWQQKR